MRSLGSAAKATPPKIPKSRKPATTFFMWFDPLSGLNRQQFQIEDPLDKPGKSHNKNSHRCACRYHSGSEPGLEQMQNRKHNQEYHYLPSLHPRVEREH